jgi:hypothetical protein
VTVRDQLWRFLIYVYARKGIVCCRTLEFQQFLDRSHIYIPSLLLEPRATPHKRKSPRESSASFDFLRSARGKLSVKQGM